MATSSDVRDIMGLSTPGGGSSEVTKAMILGTDKPRRSGHKRPEGARRPEGMARELYNLLYNDSKDAPPIMPTTYDSQTAAQDKGCEAKPISLP